MSTQDRQAEREVADHFNEVRPAPPERDARNKKRFLEAVFTGFAVGRVARKIF